MTDFVQFLQTPLGIVLAVAVAIGLIWAWLSSSDPFRLTDWAYRMPLVGRLARYSNDYSETRHGTWLNSEAQLCHDYAKHLTCMPRDEFENHTEYLRKCYDNGRKPMPVWAWGLFGVLLIAEAFGFSFMLAQWMAMEATESTAMLITAGIVLVLSGILLWVTHSAGHQIYRTRLLRSCFQQFQAHGLHDQSNRERNRRYTSHIISLSQDQSIDDSEPDHVQCANRVATSPHDTGSYGWVWIALGLIIVIAILSTVLRIETLYSSGEVAQMQGGFFGGGGGVDADQQQAKEYAAITSFGILATIFVVTQLVGMGIGYKFGFAGRESKQAYGLTRGCPDYETYYRPINSRTSIAKSRLASLHARMERRMPGEIDWSRDFLKFIEEERARGATDLQHPMEVAAASKRFGKFRKAKVGDDPKEPGPNIGDGGTTIARLKQ